MLMVMCPCCDGAGALNRSVAQELLVNRSAVEGNTGCWRWGGRVERTGYGIVTLDNHRWSPHRLAFVAFGGTFAAGPVVRHNCDNSLCCNPLHLCAGTQADNMRDRVARGRSRGPLPPLYAYVGTGETPTMPTNAPLATNCHCCDGNGTVDPEQWRTHLLTNSVLTEDGCRLWIGRINSSGYGDIYLNRHRFLAHRLSLIAFQGTLTSDLVARHRCNTPTCIAPQHLRPGTVQDNVNDRVARGLTIKNHGATNGGARLTSQQVTEIRQRRLAGVRLSTLEAEYGASETAMLRIVRGISWAKQDLDLIEQLHQTDKHRPGKPCRFTTADFERMAHLRANGLTLAAIATQYGVTKRMIRLYLNGETIAATAARSSSHHEQPR